MLNLTRGEHQELVLMVGSKKEWATYLGLDPTQARLIWNEFKLKSPTEYTRTLTNGDLQNLVLSHRSVAKAADYLGVSESFLLMLMEERYIYWPATDQTDSLKWSVEECKAHFEKYRSVRFVARIFKRTEGHIRKEVLRLGLEISTMIDYAHGDHSNAKGRRAELDFARMRGEHILRDLNQEVGPQADWDFDDDNLGKVNVKSSRMYRYRAKTRRGAPDFWKFSTRGVGKCDVLALLFYDNDMNVLIGMRIMKKAEVPSTESFRLCSADITIVPPRG